MIPGRGATLRRSAPLVGAQPWMHLASLIPAPPTRFPSSPTNTNPPTQPEFDENYAEPSGSCCATAPAGSRTQGRDTGDSI